MRASSIWYEMVILAMCLILGANVMVQFITQVSPSMISYTEEKSALDTEDVISMYIDKDNNRRHPRYGKDLLLALLNTDEYACYPNAIAIDNSPIFEINMSFQTQKATQLQILYDKSGPYKLGSPAVLSGEIKACILENVYETDGNGNPVYIRDSDNNIVRDEKGNPKKKVLRQFLHYYILTNPPS